MRGLVLAALALTACRNDAITYAHSLAPGAECRSIQQIDGAVRGEDVAICSLPGETWLCMSSPVPQCLGVGGPVDAPRAERP